MVKKDQAAQPIIWLDTKEKANINAIGPKAAALVGLGKIDTRVHVPRSFVVTKEVYEALVSDTKIIDDIKALGKALDRGNTDQYKALAKKIRARFVDATLPAEIEKALIHAYKKLRGVRRKHPSALAVRSSAHLENTQKSFAGQHDSFLNITTEKDFLLAVKKCFASLYTDRAITYRELHALDHKTISMAVLVQEMVASDTGVSGTMVTYDIDSGFQDITGITASYGFGQYITSGRIVPDQYHVWKPGLIQEKEAVIARVLGTKEVKLVRGKQKGVKQRPVSLKQRRTFALDQKDILAIAALGQLLESHFKTPQYIEWAKDAMTGKFFVVQRRNVHPVKKEDHAYLKTYRLKKTGDVLATGIAIGQAIAAGTVHIVEHRKDLEKVKKGQILVAQSISPDWCEALGNVAGIITEQGGKTSHAAVTSRELGIPCVVGVKGIRSQLRQKQRITIDCSVGDTATIYAGILPYEVAALKDQKRIKTKTAMSLSLSDPDHAFALSGLPQEGVSVSQENILAHTVKAHPLALLQYGSIKTASVKKKLQSLTQGYMRKDAYLTEKLATGIARIAAASYPKPVSVKLSDYRNSVFDGLLGGAQIKKQKKAEVSGVKYYSTKAFQKAFAAECEAIRRVREDWGLTNIVPIIPFCRTPEEAEKVLSRMKKYGLERGKNDLQVHVLCDMPANVVMAAEFASLFDGIVLDTDTLTKDHIGLLKKRRKKTAFADIDAMLKDVVKTAHKQKIVMRAVGQTLSDNPALAEFFVSRGIDGLSISPDALTNVRKRVSMIEKTVGRTGKKTHKKSVSFLMAMCALSVGLMAVGAGCSTSNVSVKPVTPEVEIAEVSPAAIREAAMKQVEIALADAQETHAAEMRTLTEREFAKFSIEYPAAWDLTHWNGGVTAQNNHGTSTEYMSIYRQLVAQPIFNSEKESMTVDGFEAYRYRVADREGEVRHMVEIDVDDEVIALEGKGEVFETILASLDFMNEDAITERPITHWDIRERRACIQVMTYARSGEGQCELFPTPCDVPDGWTVCDADDV